MQTCEKTAKLNRENMLNHEKYFNSNLDFQNFYEKSKFNFSPGLANGDEIEEYVEAGFLKDVDLKKINATSVDLNMNDDFLYLKGNELIDLTKGEKPFVEKVPTYEGKFYIMPSMFYLASTRAVYNLPNWLSTSLCLRSSSGRIAMNHMTAGWADPGFNGSNLTLEFHNVSNNTYIVDADCCFIQVCFHKSLPVSLKYDYRKLGGYNGKLGTIQSKGIK